MSKELHTMHWREGITAYKHLTLREIELSVLQKWQQLIWINQSIAISARAPNHQPQASKIAIPGVFSYHYKKAQDRDL